MDGHLVPASSNSKFRCSLENFTLDAFPLPLLTSGRALTEQSRSDQAPCLNQPARSLPSLKIPSVFSSL
jgi:hypothetical protein